MVLTCYFPFLALSCVLAVAGATDEEIPNVCDTGPCVDGNQQCHPLSGTDYRCVCSSECGNASCNARPCPNVNHVCNALSHTDYECVCHPDCQGANCSNCLQDARRIRNVCDTRPCTHENQICITISESSYQCICPDGCGGVNCSNCLADLTPSACSPNPCVGDCSCYESCKHAGGYYCRSDTGYLGKNCAVPVPVLRCESDKIVLSVSENFVDEYDLGMKNSYISVAPSLHEHTRSACKLYFPTNGAYEMTIPLPFSACNTTSRRTEEGVVFTNQMWFNRELGSAMFDMPIPAVEFQCTYSRVYELVTSLQPVVSNPGLVVSKKDIFPTISLCKVPTCPGSCPDMYKVSGGASYTVGELIHVTMSLDSGALNTGIAQMYLSCSGDESSRSVLDIVVDGCTAQSGLLSKIRSSFTSDIACVSFQTPRTLQCTEFYIHAELMSCASDDVEVCSPAADNVRCRSSRVRRSAPPVAWIGPIFVFNGSDGSGQITINGMDEYLDDVIPRIAATMLRGATEEEKSPGVGVINVVVVVFIAATVIALLVLIPFAYARSGQKRFFDFCSH